MKYHQLTTQKRKSGNRKGRGISAGRGKTAGRGTKGQNSRTGGGTRPGFEGGQNPLYMRLPKLPGFKSFKTPKQTVKTSELNQLSSSTIVTTGLLEEKGIIADQFSPVKLILNGEVKKAYKVQLQAASKGAIKKLEAAGGSFEEVARVKRINNDKS